MHSLGHLYANVGITRAYLTLFPFRVEKVTVIGPLLLGEAWPALPANQFSCELPTIAVKRVTFAFCFSCSFLRHGSFRMRFW